MGWFGKSKKDKEIAQLCLDIRSILNTQSTWKHALYIVEFYEERPDAILVIKEWVDGLEKQIQARWKTINELVKEK